MSDSCELASLKEESTISLPSLEPVFSLERVLKAEGKDFDMLMGEMARHMRSYPQDQTTRKVLGNKEVLQKAMWRFYALSKA